MEHQEKVMYYFEKKVISVLDQFYFLKTSNKNSLNAKVIEEIFIARPKQSQNWVHLYKKYIGAAKSSFLRTQTTFYVLRSCFGDSCQGFDSKNIPNI